MLIEAAQGAGIVFAVTAACAGAWNLMQSDATLPGGYVAETKSWDRWTEAMRTAEAVRSLSPKGGETP